MLEARQFLQKQIEELRDQLAVSEQELVEYASANQILVLQNGGSDGSGAESASQTLTAAELTAFNEALAGAISERISAQAALSSGVGISNSAPASLNDSLAEAQSDLAEIAANFGPGYPPRREAEARVNALQAAINEQKGQKAKATNQELRAAFEAAQAKENALRRELQQAKSGFLGQQNQGIRYGILKREVDTNRELYDGLLQRFKELEASGAGQNNIKLIDEAELPQFPYAPSWFQNLAVALVLSALLAAAIVYLRVLLSQTLKDPQDVKRELGLSLLGAIPDNDSDDLIGQLAERSSEFSEAYLRFPAKANPFLRLHWQAALLSLASGLC